MCSVISNFKEFHLRFKVHMMIDVQVHDGDQTMNILFQELHHELFSLYIQSSSISRSKVL
jgi:hypothetical protein